MKLLRQFFAFTSRYDDVVPTYRALVYRTVMLVLFAVSPVVGVLLADWLWRSVF